MKEPNEGRPGQPEAGAKENRGESRTDPTQSGNFRVTRIHPCAPTSGEGQLLGQPLRNSPTPPSKVGAVCGSAARTDLCGGAVSDDRPYRDLELLLAL